MGKEFLLTVGFLIAGVALIVLVRRRRQPRITASASSTGISKHP